MSKVSRHTKGEVISFCNATFQGWYRFLVIILLFFSAVGLSNQSFAGTRSSIKKSFYLLRQRCVQTLEDQSLLSSRKNVKELSGRCLEFQKKHPVSVYATRALYLSGMLWEGLYTHTKYVSDWNESLKTYGKVVALYPNSWLADDALFRSGVLYLRMGLKHLALTAFSKLLERYPKSDLRNVAKAHVQRLSHRRNKNTSKRQHSYAPYVKFKGFRYWSNKKYARLVMDFSDKASFRFKSLKTSKKTNLVFKFDGPLGLQNRKKALYGKKNEFFKNANLRKSSSFPFISVTFGPDAQCRVFTLLSPFRIVVDALQREGNRGERRKKFPKRKTQDFIICLDPGHGGKDPGATGPHGIREKDVVLRIARILREKLIKRYGYSVIMTRDRDVFIPLEERVAFANSHGADLFISIHINASHNRRLQGITTFCLSNTSDKKSLRLAARENGVPLSKMSGVEKILNDMLFCEKYNESYKVAHIIHHALMQEVRRYNPSINNLGVRHAPFYVLAGAKMPSILLELDFISNPYSEKRLVRYNYLDKIAEGISRGILKTTKTVDIAQNFN